MDYQTPNSPFPRPGEKLRREKPLCVALVLCSEVVEDTRTGNKTLVSLFNGILTPQLPALHPRLCVMASLTSGSGAWKWGFRITSPSGKLIMNMEDTTAFSDPLAVHDLVVDVRNFPLEEEGVYFVDLVIEGEQAVSRRFTVQITPDGLPPAPTNGEGA